MIDLMWALFWVGVCWTGYGYVVFPAAAAFLAARGPRRLTSMRGDMSTPTVSIVIPAYNERDHIEARIRNVLASDYPRALLDVVVVSDASTDGTDEIVRSFAAAGVRLVVQDIRRGKSAGLNRAMALVRGDVVVFTDANAAYTRDTIRTLVRYFDRPAVGLVTGYTKYRITGSGDVAEATNLYTSLERVIKKAESACGCCVGADGAVFAIRRSVYRDLRDEDINDFVIPLDVIEQGHECVFAEDVFCSENPGDSLESEFRRQSRITSRTLRALWRHRRLLNPWRFPRFSFFLFSHKVVRFTTPVFLVVSGVSLILVAVAGNRYAATAGTIAVLAIASSEFARRNSRAAGWLPFRRFLRFVNVFVTINVAVLHGWWKFMAGRADVIWQHDRSAA